jgi:hypothetical protein
VREIEPDAPDESERAGTREGHLAELCEAAGLCRIVPSKLKVTVRFPTFADWWEPFTLGVGPAGAHVARLDDAGRNDLRARCAELMPPPPFGVTASAWCVQAHP